MGLSICYKIAIALKGSIKVNSSLGNGATFIFTFVAEKPEKEIEILTEVSNQKIIFIGLFREKK